MRRKVDAMRKRVKRVFMYYLDLGPLGREWHWRTWTRNIGYGICGAAGATLVLLPVWLIVVAVTR